MNNRAVLLPHPADPLMLNYWLKFFNEIWADEVDHLYIHINSPMEAEVIAYMRTLCQKNDKITLMYTDYQLEHGTAIDRVLNLVSEEYVMLIEDDGFIFKKGQVDMHFAALERGDYDIIGSARTSCGTEILEQAALKWNLDYSGVGDRGPNFWPCFLFAKTSLLKQTDRNFAAKRWTSGERIEGLDYVAQEDQHGDTLVNTSLQLRGMVPKDRIYLVPQYHGHPDDLIDYEKSANIFNGVAGWTHIGSLSSGTHGLLTDEQGRSLARRKIDPPKENFRLPDYCRTDFERREFERRVQWFTQFYNYGLRTGVDLILPDFVTEYRSAIDRIMRRYELSDARIRERQRIYQTLGL